MSELDIVSELAGEYGWEAGVASGALWFFGPTIFAIRRNLGRWADFHSANVLRLNERIQARLDDDRDGAVHPRVAQTVIEQAPWINDDVQQEYLAGLLIASRTPEGGSERGAYYARLAAELTSQQVRVHRAIYASFAAGGPEGLDLDSNLDLDKAAVWVPLDELATIIVPEDGDAIAEIEEATYALNQRGLVSYFHETGTPDADNRFAQTSRPAFVVTPTSLGVLLYLWARGVRSSTANRLRSTLPPAPEELVLPLREFYLASRDTLTAPF